MGIIATVFLELLGKASLAAMAYRNNSTKGHNGWSGLAAVSAGDMYSFKEAALSLSLSATLLVTHRSYVSPSPSPATKHSYSASS